AIVMAARTILFNQRFLRSDRQGRRHGCWGGIRRRGLRTSIHGQHGRQTHGKSYGPQGPPFRVRGLNYISRKGFITKEFFVFLPSPKSPTQRLPKRQSLRLQKGWETRKEHSPIRERDQSGCATKSVSPTPRTELQQPLAAMHGSGKYGPSGS